MPEIDVRTIMTKIPDYFNPEKANDTSGIIQCVFSGDQASNWVIRIENQTCTVEEGQVNKPDLTIKADAEDGVKVLTGKLGALRAYMSGKIKIKGDLSLGKKLANFFDKQ